MRGSEGPTPLEETTPVYRFHEVHRRWVNAQPDDVWLALGSRSFDQLPHTQPLVALRGLGHTGSDSARDLFTGGLAHECTGWIDMVKLPVPVTRRCG